MIRRRILLLFAGALGCLSLAGAASGAAEEPEPNVLRAAFSSFPDYLDPQLSYTAEGWTAMSDIYIPLLTFRQADGQARAAVVPGLAQALPKITDGGRTYTLSLRPGLRYSDGRRIKASDFEYAIERLLRLHSGGAPFYMVIAGASRYARTHRGGIGGIDTDDRSGRIVIHLDRPTSTFPSLLALLFAAPVPRGTPMHDLSGKPPPASGPYVIDSSEPGLGWSYERNPAWASHNGPLVSDVPAGHVDRIEVTVVRNPVSEVRRVLSGRLDWMQNPPPSSMLPSLRRKYGGTQLREDPESSTYYFWLNTTRAPFNDVRVRRAVNYAVDPRVLRRIYAGQIAPTHQVLPPGMPGYRRFDLYPHDMARARRLLAAAHPRDRRITVWADDESPNLEATEYFVTVLRELGFHARLKVVSSDIYFLLIGKASTPNLDAGWSDWFQDFPHPDDFLRPLLLGSSIRRVETSNFARIDAPALDSKVEELSRFPLTPATERRYAALDRGYMKLAPWVPYGTRTLATLVSRRVDLSKMVVSPVSSTYLTSLRLR